MQEKKFGLYESPRTNMIGEKRSRRSLLCSHVVACRNAIKVENIGRMQVGHIPRENAARLAPLMDRREITVEGVMHEGNREW